MRSRRAIFFRQEASPQRHLGPQHRKVVRGDNLAEDVTRFLGNVISPYLRLAQYHSGFVPCDETAERRVALIVIKVVSIGEKSAPTAGLITAAKVDQAVRVFER